MKTKFYILAAALLIIHAAANAQFVREYNPGVNSNLRFQAVVKAQNGNYFIGGLQDSSVYVSEVNSNGNIIREKLVGVNNKTYTLNAMIVDADGNIVIVGFLNAASPAYKAFLMKLSPALSVILHVTYTNKDNVTEPLAFTDVKDYKTTGTNAVNNAYYVSAYNVGSSTGPDAVLMRLDRTTGAVLTKYDGQPLPASTNDVYDALWLDTAQTAAAPPAILVTGRLSSGSTNTFRPWVTKHNIGTLAFASGERYLKDITQTARLYNAGIVKDIPKNNILYAWYGNLTGVGYPKAIGMGSVNANTLLPVFQKQYNVTPAFQNFIVLNKVDTDPNGYVAHGSWWDSASAQGEIFLIRTDKNGMPVWARQYKNVLNDITPHNSTFLIDGSNIFAIGYKVIAGFRRGVLIRTPVATGAMDTACALVLTIKTADSTFKKADHLDPIALNVVTKTDPYPIDCVTTTGKKPCDTCVNKAVKLTPDFTLTGTLVNNSTTFTIQATAYTNSAALNSQFVVSAVNATFVDIGGTVWTDGPAGVWGTAASTNFGGYYGTAPSAGIGVFQQLQAYRIKHFLSTTNNCGVMVKDSASKIIFMCNTCKTPGTKFTIIDEDKDGSNLSRAVLTPASNNGASRIFPNPANTSVTFNATGLDAPGMVLHIVNGNGQKISIFNVASKGKLTVNTNSMANGLYLYQVISNGKTVDQGKFVIQH